MFPADACEQGGTAPSQLSSQKTQNPQMDKTPAHKQETLSHSCLLPRAQHQFDWLINSVLHQLSLQGWQPFMTYLLHPYGVPATSTSQKVPSIQLSLTHLKITEDSSWQTHLTNGWPSCSQMLNARRLYFTEGPVHPAQPDTPENN